MGRQLDDVQENRLRRTTLHGDSGIELHARTPVRSLSLGPAMATAVPAPVACRELDLGGRYLMASCAPPNRSVEAILHDPFFAQQFGDGLSSGWHLPTADRSGWVEVTVPCTVQGALVESGELPDPLVGSRTMDELEEHGTPRDVPWFLRKTRIEQSEWWFARTFRVPEEWPGDSVRLCFDGIDYAATIYLNGESLGYHEGMFGGPELDVTQLLLRGEDNVLVVRVHPVPGHWYGVLKGSPGWGWHYGHLISTGIWRGVLLQEVAPVEVRHPFVSTVAMSEAAATLALEIDLESRDADLLEGALEILVRGPEGDVVAQGSSAISVPFGTTRLATSIVVERPRLWWPAGYGDQPMYRLEATLETRHGAAGGRCVFGIRTISMDTVDGTEAETDYRWRFVINGQPMFIKGANWCWTDPYLAAPLDERIFELTRRSGVQMLRAWGGGMVESDEFYDACDRAGILVYQEFPLSFGPHDAPLTDLAVIDRQVVRVVRRLRNHPSLVLWGGGNENPPSQGADEALTVVGRRCRSYDPSRPFHRTDPWGGSLHNYDVYHYGAPMDSAYLAKPSVFYGEWGSPSVPRMSNLEAVVGRSALDHWPPRETDRALLAHMPQFVMNDFAKLLRYTDYGPIANWSALIEYSQLVQADNHRFVAERARADPSRTSGFWLYKMTELFPGTSWGVIDFHGAPKRGYYTVARFCRAVHAFATYERYDWPTGSTFEARCHLSNDGTSAIRDAVVVASLYDASLTEVQHKEFPVAELGPGRAVDLGGLSTVVGPDHRPLFMSVGLLGDPSGGSWYWFNVRRRSERMAELAAVPPLDYDEPLLEELFRVCAEGGPSPLSSLPPAQIAMQVVQAGPTSVELHLSNVSDVPALSLEIDDGRTATEGFLSDNYLFLAPQEVRVIRLVLSEGQSMEGFTVRGWNVEKTVLAGGDRS